MGRRAQVVDIAPLGMLAGDDQAGLPYIGVIAKIGDRNILDHANAVGSEGIQPMCTRLSCENGAEFLGQGRIGMTGAVRVWILLGSVSHCSKGWEGEQPLPG